MILHLFLYFLHRSVFCISLIVCNPAFWLIYINKVMLYVMLKNPFLPGCRPISHHLAIQIPCTKLHHLNETATTPTSDSIIIRIIRSPNRHVGIRCCSRSNERLFGEACTLRLVFCRRDPGVLTSVRCHLLSPSPVHGYLLGPTNVI